MKSIKNPWRGHGLPDGTLAETPAPSIAAERPETLLTRCTAAQETPLIQTSLANGTSLFVKDERGRMGLGSFKALGAAYVIAHEAALTQDPALSTALAGRTYVTASAGNHGLSVAAGAHVFGARAVIYLSETVPEGFARRLRDKGADVVIAGADYEASMAAAAKAAEDQGWTLLSDSSWPGYMDLPHRLMEGYLVLAAETARQMTSAPTHIFLQAGVGGLAGAAAAYFRSVWGDAPQITVVEPEAAPALMESIKAAAPVATSGPVSIMGRLDCKEPSLIALKGLARDADIFLTLTDEEVSDRLPALAELGLETTASGGAGLVAAMMSTLSPDDRVLCILSEAPDP